MSEVNYKLRILSFGLAAEILQKREFVYETSSKNLSELRNELTNQFPALLRLKSLAFAVNKQYQNDNFALSDDDEIALIPPVSGG